MTFDFTKGKYGLAQIIFAGVFTRISDEIDFVGKDKILRDQAIHFVVDGIFYGVWIDFRAETSGHLTFETISKLKGKKVEKYGWTRRNRAHATVMIHKENADWVLYFFKPGEIIELIRKFSDNSKRFKSFGYETEVVLVPLTHLSHKLPVRIPVVGEPDVSGIRGIHEYLKTYQS